MEKTDKMVNGEENLSIKSECEMTGVTELQDGWVQNVVFSQGSVSQSWQSIHIKDEVLKDLKDITMKEEPLEMTEGEWLNKGCTSPCRDDSPRLCIQEELETIDGSSLHNEAPSPPQGKPLNKGSINSYPKRRALVNKRRRAKSTVVKVERRVSEKDEEGDDDDLVDSSQDDVTVDSGNDDDNPLETSVENSLLRQASPEEDQEETENEPLNLKVKPVDKEGKKNGQNDPLLLPEERIKLAIQKILSTNPLTTGLANPITTGLESDIEIVDPPPSSPGVKFVAFPHCPKPSLAKDYVARSVDVVSPPANPSSPANVASLEETPLMTGYINDHELVNMNVRELNRRFRDMPKALRLKYKQRRRTLKNRQYAQNCRQKRASHRHEIESLNAILKAEVHRHQVEITRLVAQTSELRRSNEELRKNLETLRKENLTLKKDWMDVGRQEWQTQEQAAVQQKSPEKKAEAEKGEASTEKLAAEPELQESSEESDLNEEENEDDEKLQQQLKERLQQEKQSEEQQLLLQQQQSLLQQQMQILQLLQLQQQRQLQLIQQPQLLQQLRLSHQEQQPTLLSTPLLPQPLQQSSIPADQDQTPQAQPTNQVAPLGAFFLVG